MEEGGNGDVSGRRVGRQEAEWVDPNGTNVYKNLTHSLFPYSPWTHGSEETASEVCPNFVSFHCFKEASGLPPQDVAHSPVTRLHRWGNLVGIGLSILFNVGCPVGTGIYLF